MAWIRWIFSLANRSARIATDSPPKWLNWKMHLVWQENMYAAPQRLPLPRIINLLTDLKEENDVLIQNGWVTYPMMKIVNDFEESLKKYPPIKMGTPDPYQPATEQTPQR